MRTSYCLQQSRYLGTQTIMYLLVGLSCEPVDANGMRHSSMLKRYLFFRCHVY